MWKRILSISLALSLFLITSTVSSADTGKTITCSTYVTAECTGTVKTTPLMTTTCSTCGSSQANWSWSCTCGKSGSYSSCSHSHPTSNPTAHTSKQYTNSAYGYSGYSSAFTVYPLTISTSNGITCSVTVNGATATDYVLPKKLVTIRFNNVPEGYNVKVTSNMETYVLEASNSYSFNMPSHDVTVQIKATTESADIYIGKLQRGPGTTQFFYNNAGYFVLRGTSMSTGSAYLYEKGGFVSKSITGSLTLNGGGILNCSSWNDSTDTTGVSPLIYANSHSDCDTYYGTFIDKYGESNTYHTIEYTPSAQDIANGVRVGYVDNLGKISSWSTPSTTSAIRFTCSWFVIYIPKDMSSAVSPTSSFSSPSLSKEYGDSVFSVGFTTNSDGTIFYTSSDTSVAEISTTGMITLNGLGTATVTASTSKTSSYNEDSKSVTLTVSKGGLTVNTAPTPTAINYGQQLSASVLSGGSVVNKSNTTVGGGWQWKTLSEYPTAGTKSYAVKFIPTDTTHYNY